MWGHFLWLEKFKVWKERMVVTRQHVGKHASLQGPCLSSEKTGTALRNGDAHTCKSLKPTQSVSIKTAA